MCIPLTELERGRSASVVSVEGGCGMVRRLEHMGVRPGKELQRISSQLMGGPVIVSVDGRQTAMGRGMAGKIFVDPLNE
ncbi:MAG: FeoA family protein [Planctomycetota bacterium]